MPHYTLHPEVFKVHVSTMEWVEALGLTWAQLHSVAHTLAVHIRLRAFTRHQQYNHCNVSRKVSQSQSGASISAYTQLAHITIETTGNDVDVDATNSPHYIWINLKKKKMHFMKRVPSSRNNVKQRIKIHLNKTFWKIIGWWILQSTTLSWIIHSKLFVN